MGINLTCPHCGKRMTFNTEAMRAECKYCGFIRGSGLDERSAQIRARGQRPSVTISHKGDVLERARSLFETGHDYLFQEDRAEAVKAFQRALELQPDFLDPHLWLAKLSDDPNSKREHLSTVLAYDPGHSEATRLMLVLNGRLTPEQAARAANGDGPVIRRADGPVKAETTKLECPVCKGDLTIDETGRVVCRFCGYTEERANRDTGSGDSLVAAMLERKAEPVQWLIGARLLHCDECGAERTLADNELSARCPFCGSNHVIEQDALDSFEQPDLLIPFKISREEAGAAIKAELKRFSERIKNLFNSNQVARAALSGYYLPYWMFDAMVGVTRTRIDNRPPQDRRQFVAEPYSQTTFDDAVFDVGVCAVKSPPPALTEGLGPYDTRGGVAYAPELLAKYPASLYSIDFDAAALAARSLISREMVEKYRPDSVEREVSIHTVTTVKQMSFRLVLAPVWVATLLEVDDEWRAALVNGQTGKVVLGKAEKRR
jgi:DNA-directed RNA polymerase subunit RPC12/RpoP